MSEYKWKVLWIAAIGSFMGSLDGTIVNIAIPTISADLGVSFDIVQWVTIIYFTSKCDYIGSIWPISRYPREENNISLSG